jgi:hypothetical protein
MGEQQGRELQSLQHQVDTLKRVVLFDDYIEIVSAISQPTMASPAQIDLSSLVSATAVGGLFSVQIQPSNRAYWTLHLSTDGLTLTREHIYVYGDDQNQWHYSKGICPIASDKTIYYHAERLGATGNATWSVKLHGYLDKA